MKPTTWEEAAEWAARSLSLGVVMRGVSGASALDRAKHNVDVLHDAPEMDNAQAQLRFTFIAEAGLSMYCGEKGVGIDEIEKSLQHVVETIISKQHDYGHENIAWGGRAGLVLRTHDKLARIENLLARGDDAANESLDDSYLDVTGYGLIGMMWEAGHFMLPLAADRTEPACPFEKPAPTTYIAEGAHGHAVGVRAYPEQGKVHVGTFHNDDGQVAAYGPYLDREGVVQLLNNLLDALEDLGAKVAPLYFDDVEEAIALGAFEAA